MEGETMSRVRNATEETDNDRDLQGVAIATMSRVRSAKEKREMSLSTVEAVPGPDPEVPVTALQRDCVRLGEPSSEPPIVVDGGETLAL